MPIKQVPESVWNEVAHPIRLCGLPYTIDEFCSEHELKSFRYPEDGLGTMEAIVIDIAGSLFWLFAPANLNTAYGEVTVHIRSFESDSSRALNGLLKAFEFKARKTGLVS